jgi:hypothetical protein
VPYFDHPSRRGQGRSSTEVALRCGLGTARGVVVAASRSLHLRGLPCEGVVTVRSVGPPNKVAGTAPVARMVTVLLGRQLLNVGLALHVSLQEDRKCFLPKRSHAGLEEKNWTSRNN